MLFLKICKIIISLYLNYFLFSCNKPKVSCTISGHSNDTWHFFALFWPPSSLSFILWFFSLNCFEIFNELEKKSFEARSCPLTKKNYLQKHEKSVSKSKKKICVTLSRPSPLIVTYYLNDPYALFNSGLIVIIFYFHIVNYSGNWKTLPMQMLREALHTHKHSYTLTHTHTFHANFLSFSLLLLSAG